MTDKQSRKISSFDYRTALGCWINDIASIPRVEQWPSTKFDAGLEQDFIKFFYFLKEIQFNSVILFGLFIAGGWEPDFKRSFSPEREKSVRRVLAEAKKRGIQVLYGLGIYSWGFDKIIKEDPKVRGTNPHAMCGSKEASHRKMESLVDYLCSEFSFDGFHLESFDQGRCECKLCKEKSDLHYHIELNEYMARYIRSRWPGKTIEVYTPGALTKEDWLEWSGASQYFTFLIDPSNSADRCGYKARKEIISSLSCAYGTRSGTWVYPPQRWKKLRWFLPIIERRAIHYRKLAEDGGRAAMVQTCPIINPGEEATLRCSGKFIQDPFRAVQSVLFETVKEMFDPRTSGVTDELADIFWIAEKSYFAFANCTDSLEIYLEPLCGKIAGPPVYLETRVYPASLSGIEIPMKNIRKRFIKIKEELRDKDKAKRMEICLDNVLKDISRVKQNIKNMPKFAASTINEKTWSDKWLWGKNWPPA